MTYKFQLRVCPDGAMTAHRKGGTADTQAMGVIAGACKKIPYVFTMQLKYGRTELEGARVVGAVRQHHLEALASGAFHVSAQESASRGEVHGRGPVQSSPRGAVPSRSGSRIHALMLRMKSQISPSAGCT